MFIEIYSETSGRGLLNLQSGIIINGASESDHISIENEVRDSLLSGTRISMENQANLLDHDVDEVQVFEEQLPYKDKKLYGVTYEELKSLLRQRGLILKELPENFTIEPLKTTKNRY